MKRNRIIWGSAAFAAVVVVAFVWYFFIRDDAPPPLSLEGAVAAATSSPPGTDPTTQTVTTAADTTTMVRAEGGTTWTVDASRSIVGYRIEEELAGIGGNTAVGRTSDVSGSLALDGAVITGVSVAVDMTTLASDDGRRDRQLRSRGLETDRFPDAAFALDEAVDLGVLPAIGEEIEVAATGTLTLHGVSRSVTVPIQAKFLDEATIVAVGSTEVVLTDYDIDPPTGFSVLSVADTGVFELQLTFTM